MGRQRQQRRAFLARLHAVRVPSAQSSPLRRMGRQRQRRRASLARLRAARVLHRSRRPNPNRFVHYHRCLQPPAARALRQAVSPQLGGYVHAQRPQPRVELRASEAHRRLPPPAQPCQASRRVPCLARRTPNSKTAQRQAPLQVDAVLEAVLHAGAGLGFVVLGVVAGPLRWTLLLSAPAWFHQYRDSAGGRLVLDAEPLSAGFATFAVAFPGFAPGVHDRETFDCACAAVRLCVFRAFASCERVVAPASAAAAPAAVLSAPECGGVAQQAQERQSPSRLVLAGAIGQV